MTSDDVLEIEELIFRSQGSLAREIARKIIRNWLRGAKAGADLGGVKPNDILAGESPLQGPPRRPPNVLLGPFGEEEIRFPGLERAVERLVNQQVLSPSDYYALEAKAKEEAFTISGDLGQKSIEKIRELLAENLEGPSNYKTFIRRARETVEELPISDSHLEAVFRNAANSAYSDGLENVLDNPLVGSAFPYAMSAPIFDARMRPEHGAIASSGLNGTAIFNRLDPVWKQFRAPWSWNCILPGQSVQGSFNTGFKSWYDGEIVKLTTRKGNHLAMTINHPVFTENGIVAAGSLNEGDGLLAYHGKVKARNYPDRLRDIASNETIFSSPNFHKQNSPATIEQVFDAICQKGASLGMRVNPKDFHGDARFMEGNVDIVTVNRILLLDLEAASAQGDSDLCLTKAPAFTFRLGLENQSFIGRYSSGGGFPGSRTLPLNSSTILLEDAPFDGFGFGAASGLDASVYEPATDCGAINPEAFGQRILGSSPEITLDEIVHIERDFYVGHVYDLQSSKGWIVSENLLVSNCRCGWIPMTIRDAAKLGVREAKEWLDSGQEPTQFEFVEWPKYNGQPIEVDPSWRRL